MVEHQPHIRSGSNSINLGQGSSVSDSSLHVGDVHNHAQPNEPIAFIDRVKSKPVRVAGHQLQASWLTVSGVVGFIGSLASIAGYWQRLSFWFVLLLSAAAFCFILGVGLTRQRFLRIPLLPYNFEADRQGRVFLTRVEGDCPLCDGKLKLRDIGPKEHKVTYVRCTRNPDHIWRFDFTVLDEPGG